MNKMKLAGKVAAAAVAIDESRLSPLELQKLRDKRRQEALDQSLREFKPDAAQGGGGLWDENSMAVVAAQNGVVPTMDVHRILVEPNECRSDDAIKIEFEFHLDGCVLKPIWEINVSNPAKFLQQIPASNWKPLTL